MELHLVNEDYLLLQHLVDHIYCFQYSPAPLVGEADDYISALEVYVQMYEMADNWDAKDPMDKATENIQDYMQAN